MAKVLAFTKLFSDLTEELEAVEATSTIQRVNSIQFPGMAPQNSDLIYVDQFQFLGWRMRVKNLLSRVCGENSVQYQEFLRFESPSGHVRNHVVLLNLKAIFLAAKRDYEGGHLNSTRQLVQAELFDNQLDQAKELLSAGYYPAAAVVAGVVLETHLRQMCADRGIAVGKLDRMNIELGKQGAYVAQVRNDILALAGIRNNAAHGHYDRFRREDVSNMITKIESLITEHV